MADIKSILKDIRKVSVREADYIEQKIKELNKKILTAQDKLFSEITTGITSRFKESNGAIRLTEYNMRLTTEIEAIMQAWRSEFQDNILKQYSKDLINLEKFTKDHYLAVGVSEAKIAQIAQKSNIIASMIGIDKKGNVIKNSYLDRLSQVQDVKQTIANKMVANVSGGNMSMKSMVTDMRELIVGNKNVDGTLQRYYKQYAHDTFSQASQANLTHYSENLGLTEFFIYQGGLIQSSRKFCCQRNGLIWSKEKGDEWNAMDWAGKSGDFFSNVGGYNCRHQLRWVSRELAESVGYDGAYNSDCE